MWSGIIDHDLTLLFSYFVVDALASSYLITPRIRIVFVF